VTPALRFEYDTTPDTARRVEELLRDVHGDDEDEPT
jgi:ribosome-binding factor A